MHRHFVPTKMLEESVINLTREDSRHFALVLRLKRGEEVELFDGKGKSAFCKIANDARSGMVLERQGEVIEHEPCKVPIILGACISKGKRMDWTIEKAVELGVNEIIPIASDFSVVRVDDEEKGDKLERFERIAIDAARQSSSYFIPKIHPPTSLQMALSIQKEGTISFAGALTDDSIPFWTALSAQTSNSALAFFVGPEGDFSPREYSIMRTSNVIFVSLGPQILRTETAALYGLSLLNAFRTR